MRMTKQELYNWYVRNGDFDVRAKKSIGGDDIYRAVFPAKFFSEDISKEDVRFYVKQGWIAEKQISDAGVIRNVFYWTGETVGQRSITKAALEKTAMSNMVKWLASIVDRTFAAFIRGATWVAKVLS